MQTSAHIAPLTVVHRLRDNTGDGLPARQVRLLSERGFYAATCMRELAVLPSADTLRGLQLDRDNEVLHNAAAYAFLLHTVTGLNSSIPGETNVQGQLRKAWNSWRSTGDNRVARLLSPTIHRLFNDARDIRRDYLQGIGGSSYGSLVRKLMAPDADARVLFVGAGDLAQSMLTFFSAGQTAVWSRHEPDSGPAATVRRFPAEQREAAAAWATHLIVTTPPDNDNDRFWAQLALLHDLPVTHLGRRRAAPGDWDAVPGFHNLDDVFDLRRAQSSLRSLSTVRARNACNTLAFASFSSDFDTAPALAALSA